MKRCVCCRETDEELRKNNEAGPDAPVFLDSIEVVVGRYLHCTIDVCVWCARPMTIALADAIAQTTEVAVDVRIKP